MYSIQWKNHGTNGDRYFTCETQGIHLAIEDHKMGEFSDTWKVLVYYGEAKSKTLGYFKVRHSNPKGDFKHTYIKYYKNVILGANEIITGNLYKIINEEIIRFVGVGDPHYGEFK